MSRPRIRTTLITALLVVAILAVDIPSASAGMRERRFDVEREFVKLINQERRAEGLSTLKVNYQATRIARRWSKKMDKRDDLAHNPNMVEQFTPEWRRLGENVGVGPSVDSLHEAFMNSPGHRANVLGDYSLVGVGVSFDGSRIWVTINFVKGRNRDFPVFNDVKGGRQSRLVGKAWQKGIVKNCRFTKLCARRTVSRAELATYLYRAMDLPRPDHIAFDDIKSRYRARAATAVVEAGVMKGCRKGENTFCPGRDVRRKHLARAITRALDLEATRIASFSDVSPTSVYAEPITAVFEERIMGRCREDRFCPRWRVRRGYAARVLTRAFG